VRAARITGSCFAEGAGSLRSLGLEERTGSDETEDESTDCVVVDVRDAVRHHRLRLENWASCAAANDVRANGRERLPMRYVRAAEILHRPDNEGLHQVGTIDRLRSGRGRRIHRALDLSQRRHAADVALCVAGDHAGRASGNAVSSEPRDAGLFGTNHQPSRCVSVHLRSGSRLLLSYARARRAELSVQRLGGLGARVVL